MWCWEVGSALDMEKQQQHKYKRVEILLLLEISLYPSCSSDREMQTQHQQPLQQSAGFGTGRGFLYFRCANADQDCELWVQYSQGMALGAWWALQMCVRNPHRKSQVASSLWRALYVNFPWPTETAMLRDNAEEAEIEGRILRRWRPREGKLTSQNCILQSV